MRWGGLAFTATPTGATDTVNRPSPARGVINPLTGATTTSTPPGSLAATTTAALEARAGGLGRHSARDGSRLRGP